MRRGRRHAQQEEEDDRVRYHKCVLAHRELECARRDYNTHPQEFLLLRSAATHRQLSRLQQYGRQGFQFEMKWFFVLTINLVNM